MRVLLLGGGGREHALAWKLAQSPALSRLWCAPGNPGTGRLGQNVPIAADDPGRVVEVARQLAIDLVVVGPEAPLVAGVADALEEADVPVFGPCRRAAAIEGSKVFAKEVMASAGVPTAAWRAFESMDEAAAIARAMGRVVVKVDGLAAGKGVVVAREANEAEAAVRDLGALVAGRRLLLEELLEGEEISVIALCDGERYALLPAAQDHKRLGEGDLGPNTGGMGAYSPVPFFDHDALEAVGTRVIAPILRELAGRGAPFRGALYAGVMLTRDGPRVLEFNCRLGDPEAQVVVLQLAEDLLPLLDACAHGRLKQREVAARRGASVGVVLAAQGYPGTPRVGDTIFGADQPGEEVEIFHASTRLEGARLVTAGGRVMTVCARGDTVERARASAYEAAERVRFHGVHFRRDIAARALIANP